MASDNPTNNPFLSGEATPPKANRIEPSYPKTNIQEPPRPVVSPAPVNPVPRDPAQTANVSPKVLAPPSKSRRWLWILLVVLSIGLVGAGVFFWFRGGSTVPVLTPVQPDAAAPKDSPLTVEKKEPTTTGSTAEYTSENFKAGEIVFGGEIEFLQDEESLAPLEISGIRGEAFTEKNKQEVKLVVTWKTNKLSISDILYAKGVGQAEKVVSEEGYGFNHSVIVTGLDPASTYLYTIKSSDRFGNTTESEPHAVFTGVRSVSLFDLIAGAIGDVFGWAVDK